jgi:SAM-dependent methyltransferase
VTAYDDVPYIGRAYPDTHPNRLATVATLFGMTPAAIEHCRVLEVGCGDAANLLPMAYGLPESDFVGFDLAAGPVAAGLRAVERLGLRNLSLAVRNLADFPADAGRFDYVVAHGIYSWVPPETRDGLLALVARHLAPNGVAFVSYNVFPGCHMRRMVWEMLRFHVDHLPDARQRIVEAQTLARLLANGRAAPDEYTAVVQRELDQVADRDPGFLFHDDLAVINDPVYFHEFADHAARHGLQFLGDAELQTMSYVGLTPQVRSVLAQLDPLTREQYLDFVRLRRFRQTLLCRAEAALDREIGPERLDRFLLGARAPVRVAGASATGEALGADEALLQAILDEVAEAAPRALTSDELIARVRARIGAAHPKANDTRFLRELTLGAARAGGLQLHCHAPRLATEPGERPLASAVARLQAESDDIVTTLWHDSVKLDDEAARALLPLLDGTRDRAALVAALGARLAGKDGVSPAEALDIHLKQFANLALLLA